MHGYNPTDAGKAGKQVKTDQESMLKLIALTVLECSLVGWG